MIHPDTELQFINDVIGYGVVATHHIPKGTITWVMDHLDRTFTPNEISSMEPIYRDIFDKYTFRDCRGNYVLCWDHGRFINHSFHPTCITTTYDFELAVRDISPGEQLTNDYGTLNVTTPFSCLPEKRSARKVVMPDDLLYYYPQWDRKLRSAFKNYLNVDQPLIHLVPKPTLRKAEGIAKGIDSLDSIRSCFCGQISEPDSFVSHMHVK